MLQSRVFLQNVLRHSSFSRRVLSVVIDEAHCLSHWGADFRKKYSSLGIVRAFLPRGTPIIAVTATLTDRVCRDLQAQLHFPKSGSLYVNIGDDRPNVSIVVRACEHPLNTFANLAFLLPATITCASDIRKVYVYADDIKLGNAMVDHLQAALSERNSALGHAGLIRPYNATMSEDYKQAAMRAFRTGAIRILVCTDAAGMVSHFTPALSSTTIFTATHRDVTSLMWTLLSNGNFLPRSRTSCNTPGVQRADAVARAWRCF